MRKNKYESMLKILYKKIKKDQIKEKLNLIFDSSVSDTKDEIL